MSSTVIYTFIDTPEKLEQAAKEWKGCPEFGIDLECENNLHHYGSYISLIQMTSKNGHWIVDMLALKNFDPLLQLLTDKSVLKIFHDVSFDFRILKDEFNIVPKHIFDTEKAAVMLGKEHVGLGALLEEYFSIKKESKFQMADWTKRPIKPAMLEYAIKDTAFLIKLKDQLSKELKEKNRLKWAHELFEQLEHADYTTKKPDYRDVRGFSSLTSAEQSIFKEMYAIREKLAKKVDMPVHFIINNKRLKELVSNPPKNIQAWAKIKGVHPIVRSRARAFHKAVENGRKNPLKKERKIVKRYNEEQKRHMRSLNEVRDSLAQHHDLPPHVILSKDDVKEIVVSKSHGHLQSWQRNLLETELDKKTKHKK